MLHAEVKRLTGRANTLLAEVLAHLAELEARGAHRERACSSLFAYCVYELRMSEDEAQRRCRAARLARQFPALLAMLAEASLHLTGILLIGPHLTPENHRGLLARVRYRTKREIERIVAELAPAPDAPARIEPLQGGPEPSAIDVLTPPRPRNTWAAYVRALAGPIRNLEAGTGAGQAPPAAVPESSADLAGTPSEIRTGAPTPPPPPPGPRYRVQFTADQAFLDLLEEARDLSQHSLPNRDLVEVQRRALQTLVKTLRARKLAATDHPRARRAAATPGEATPEETRAGAAPHSSGGAPHRLATRRRSLHLHRPARPTLPGTSRTRAAPRRTPRARRTGYRRQPDAALLLMPNSA
ncbi:MAG TPA: hypothetical protein VFS67_08140 [Polyangiaceae bacterium]|nr:hypothetical protein [Polyangiaceae bacterium]